MSLLDADDFDSATRTLQRLLIRDPNHAAARSTLLEIYLARGQGSRALRQIDWLEDNSSRPGLLDARVYALVTLGRYEDVLAITGDTEKLSEQSARLRAWSFLQLGDLDSAQESYARMLGTFPGRQHAQLGLARVALLGNDFDTALPRVIAILENDQTFADAWLVFGDLLLRMRRYKEAEDAFSRARALDASYLVSTTGISRALLYQGQAGAATQTAVELQRRYPTNVEVQFLAGEISEAMNQTDDALRHYQSIVSTQARHFGANLKLGTIAFRKGAMSTATSYLSVAVDHLSRAAEARLLLAEVERQAGRMESAEEHLAKLFHARPESEATPYSLCPAGPTALSYEEYKGLLELWLSREPNDVPARITLAIEAEITGDDATASRHYQQVLETDPGNLLAQQRLQVIRESNLAVSNMGSTTIDREQSDLGGFRCTIN